MLNRRPRIACLILLLTAVGILCADPPAKNPDPEAAWKEICTLAPYLLKRTREALLAEKDITHPPLVFHKYRYAAKTDKGKSYGLDLSAFYFSRILKDKTIAEIYQTVRDLSKTAADFHKKNVPLLADAEKLERLAALLRKSLVKSPADAAALKPHPFEGDATDELSTCLRRLSASVAGGRNDEAVIWAAELEAATSRLTDILRWVDLQTDWIVDACTVYDSFKECVENSDREVAEAGGWKPYMFGRIAGGSSIMELATHDALAAEVLLCDLLATSAGDSAAMGKLKPGDDALNVIPTHRAAYAKVRDALPPKARAVLSQTPKTPYELSAFNSNLKRYDEEQHLDQLIATLKRYASQYSKPTVTQMMEVIHIAQGAYGSTTAAQDRYHKQMVEWAARVKGTPEQAIEKAHDLAYGYYTRDGGGHYRGAIWTMHDVFEAGSLDCIRGSQMIGDIYVNAGYAGLHPVRVCRGNRKQKMVGTSGHTFCCVHLEGRNVCLDSLIGRAFLKPFEQTHARDRGVLSVAKGYRILDSYATGEFRFPQGPFKTVQLRIPYYHLERNGLD